MQGVEDVGKSLQIVSTHLDDAQPRVAEAGKQAAHGRRLPGAPLAVEQHVVVGETAQQLFGVAHQPRERAVHADQVGQVEMRGLGDRHEAPASAPRLVAERTLALEGGGGGRQRERFLEQAYAKLEGAIEPIQDVREAPHRGGL